MINQELKRLGIMHTEDKTVVDASPAYLVEAALEHGEGELSDTGALSVLTGVYTGRSPQDRFIVDTPEVHDTIAWGAINKPFPIEDYNLVKEEVLAYLSERTLYINHLLAGADRRYSRKFFVVCELASQSLFASQMLVRPTQDELANYGEPDFVVLAAPMLKLDPEKFHTHSEAAVLLNFTEKVILVVGTQYSGEVKKSIFSTMNYILPVEDNVLTMHCSCNVHPETGASCVFFGLSGTGKTTLSAAEDRLLIGDDEHVWAAESVFNIEGGCYAKTINITPQTEPQVCGAIKFGSLIENVKLDPDTRVPDYFDVTLTENGRASYPVDYIPGAVLSGVANSVPDVVIFLTADAFGVLPPISKLSRDAAMYHFMTGFTSKVAGTERGIIEPVPTFSSLFGEPFMPLDPYVYAKMLGEKIDAGNTRVYLINTGWSGGPYGVGARVKLKFTRKMVEAAQSGAIEKAEFVEDKRFNLSVPTTCPEVPSEILWPRDTWEDKAAYDEAAEKLAQMFVDNAEKRLTSMSDEVRAAGPHPLG